MAIETKSGTKEIEGSGGPGGRRSEDIALDLLKFVAAHANVGAKSAGSTGFGVPSAAKAEDQVAHLLELYTKCREAVEAPLET